MRTWCTPAWVHDHGTEPAMLLISAADTYITFTAPVHSEIYCLRSTALLRKDRNLVFLASSTSNLLLPGWLLSLQWVTGLVALYTEVIARWEEGGHSWFVTHNISELWIIIILIQRPNLALAAHLQFKSPTKALHFPNENLSSANQCHCIFLLCPLLLKVRKKA